MHGPIRLIRSKKIQGYRNLGQIYAWTQGQAYLFIDRISFHGRIGAVLCHHNPPMHQVGTPGLHAYLDGLDKCLESRASLEFFILCGANDPVHTGGDLKESLHRLKETLKLKGEKKLAGASPEEIDKLFEWGESRLQKGIILHGKIRGIARHMRVVGLCGGGIRYGGSAEIPLMADYLIGDSRSGMCFSEAMIGIIPGWAGIARVLIKAGLTNTAFMTKTARVIHAQDLKDIGIYNDVVNIPFPFPKRQRTGDPEGDRRFYLEALEFHEDRTGAILFRKALKFATCPVDDIPLISDDNRKTLADDEKIDIEVQRRTNPANYSHIWHKPLKDVEEEISRLGRPLAPQSIKALNDLFQDYHVASIDELAFVKKELEADAALYRDPRFLEGLTAMLEQRVPNFCHPSDIDS